MFADGIVSALSTLPALSNHDKDVSLQTLFSQIFPNELNLHVNECVSNSGLQARVLYGFLSSYILLLCFLLSVFRLGNCVEICLGQGQGIRIRPGCGGGE